jgi:hypothetical protein
LFGAPLFVIGGPAVHWSHGDFGKGLVSFGGNVAIPMIAGFAGRSIRCSGENAAIDCASRGFYTGATIAAMITSAVDAVVLGWEDIPVDDALARPGPRVGSSRFTIAPWSAAGQGGVELGVLGSF